MGKLYSFGCSFSDVIFKNAEIKTKGYPKHKLYTELLADSLNLELITDAYDGRGNNTILLNLAMSDFDDNSIVIIQLTISNRLELKKWYNKDVTFESDVKITHFTHATMNHFADDKDINRQHLEDYTYFVTTFYDILCFNDLHNLNNIIKNKENKFKNCKFYVITALKYETDLFLRNEYLRDIIDINGIMTGRYDNWSHNDPHLTDEGNLTLFNDLYKIITNEN
jgi:hypothetical protein